MIATPRASTLGPRPSSDPEGADDAVQEVFPRVWGKAQVFAGPLQPTPNTQGFDALVYDAGRSDPSFASAKLTLQPKRSAQAEGVPVLIPAR